MQAIWALGYSKVQRASVASFEAATIKLIQSLYRNESVLVVIQWAQKLQEGPLLTFHCTKAADCFLSMCSGAPSVPVLPSCCEYKTHIQQFWQANDHVHCMRVVCKRSLSQEKQVGLVHELLPPFVVCASMFHKGLLSHGRPRSYGLLIEWCWIRGPRADSQLQSLRV